MKTISLDFDGVVHEYKDGYAAPMGEPLPGAKEAMTRLRKRGYQLVIHTVRDPVAVKGWLEMYLPEFTDILVSDRKQKAIAYVDDRAIRFVSWKDTLNYF